MKLRFSIKKSESFEVVIMSILTSPYLLVTSGLIAFLMQFFFELTYISTNTPPGLEDDNTAITRNLNILQSHPSCGIPSGGREECWWNCTRCFNAFFQVIYFKHPGFLNLILYQSCNPISITNLFWQMLSISYPG